MPRPFHGQIQTVLGAVAPEAIGVTLPHEHLLIDFKVMFAEPAGARDKGRAWEPESLADVGWARQNFNANPANPPRLDERVAQDDIRFVQRAPGGTLDGSTPQTRR